MPIADLRAVANRLPSHRAPVVGDSCERTDPVKPRSGDASISPTGDQELLRKIAELEARLGVLEQENRALHGAEAARQQAALANGESEAKFRAIFAQSPIAIVITSLPDGRVADANPAAERMLGRSLADVRGTMTKDLNAWADLADRDRYLELLQRQGFVNGFESRMLRSDGGELVVLYHGHVVRIGGQSFVLNSLLDITDRRRVEDELRWRTAFIEAQMDTALDGILMVDSTGRQVFQNKRVVEMWKIPPEIANDPDDSRQVAFVVNRTKDPRQFGEKVGYLYAHPEVTSRDIIELTDGTVLDRYSAPVRDREGKHYGRLWTFRDVTEQKLAEAEVRHLANFPELNPNPVLEFAADGTLTYHNPAALTLARVVGTEAVEQMLPTSMRSIVAECLATDRPRLHFETQLGPRTLAWSFYPIASQSVVYGYVDDITDRQSLEEQLRHSQKMDAIGQLAGGVAHDFNNLLTAIMGHLGLLRENPQLTPSMALSLGEIAASAQRAAKLTSQLLAFGRRQVITTVALDLNEVVNHLTQLLQRVLGENINMQLEFSARPLNFLGDANMMEQVLVNLAVNARDAMVGGGDLRIATRSETRVPPSTGRPDAPSAPAEFVRLSVIDTGTGIAPEILPRIFDPFFTTKEVGKGTGLGLATVFGIVQQHNGWIEVESTVAVGTTFHVFLPKVDLAPTVLVEEIAAPPQGGRGELILLVEDDQTVQAMSALALKSFGYRVLVAGNGHEALALWSEHKTEIALLLTDLIMPGSLSGWQVARQLLAENPLLPVIYSSGYSPEIAGKELTLSEGVNYMAKPYDLDRLFGTVRLALDSGKNAQPG